MGVGIVKPRRLNSRGFFRADFNFTANELQKERALATDLPPKQSPTKKLAQPANRLSKSNRTTQLILQRLPLRFPRRTSQRSKQVFTRFAACLQFLSNP